MVENKKKDEKKVVVDFINSWKSTTKKRKYILSLRIGRIDFFYFEFKLKDVNRKDNRIRIMIFNYGVEF